MKVNDLTEVSDEPTSTLVAPGTYSVVVTDAQERVASTGRQGIGFDLEIVEGPQKGRAVWDTCWLSEKAMWRIKKVLSALQYPIPEGEFDLNPADLIGRRMFVAVEHEEYDGKVRAVVKNHTLDASWDGVVAQKPADDGVPF
jgi:hypothetical protein